MKVTKGFSLEIEDITKFEEWKKFNNIKNDSQGFRMLLKTAGVIDAM